MNKIIVSFMLAVFLFVAGCTPPSNNTSQCFIVDSGELIGEYHNFQIDGGVFTTTVQENDTSNYGVGTALTNPSNVGIVGVCSK